MRILPLIATGALLAGAPALAAAPAKAPAPTASAAAKPPADVDDAMLYLKVMISALQSDQVEQPVKGTLVSCLYNNSLAKITENMGKLIALNPGKVSRDNPNSVLSAIAAVCGYRPSEAKAAPAAPATK